MQYNFKKHYYDPYDSLDAEWKVRISHEMLSVGHRTNNCHKDLWHRPYEFFL